MQVGNVWLWLHVPLLAASYLLLFGAAVGGVFFLLQDRWLKRREFLASAGRWPSLDSMDAFSHRLLLWAFPLLTLGMITGSLWAHQTRGHYWAWTPKETFALVTWLLYALYFAVHGFSSWRGRKATYFSIAGCLLALLTWFLVTTLPKFGTY